MLYKIIDVTKNAVAVSETAKFTKNKMSHLMVFLSGTAIDTVELAKFKLNVHITGENISGTRHLVTGCKLSSLATYTDASGGVCKNSTTQSYILIPIGSLNFESMDLNVEIWTTSALAANDCRIAVYAVRFTDNLAVMEYQERNISLDGKTLPNIVALFDVSSGITDTEQTKLTFENGSNLLISHDAGFVLFNTIMQVEAQTAWSCIYMDKDMNKGRTIRIEPTTAAWNAFIVQYGSIQSN